MPSIVRLTLFKLPAAADVQEAVTRYSSLTQDAVKDGKPYVQQARADAAHADPRSQGVTLVARTVFASKQDMDYYDDECAAHGAIKAFLKPRVAGPPLVVYVDGE